MNLKDDEESQSFQKTLSENVNKRLIKGLNDIKQRHENGTHERDGEGMGPTGPSYRARLEQQRQDQAESQAAKAKENFYRQQQQQILAQDQIHSNDHQDYENADSSEDEYDRLLDEVQEDPTILALRQQRLENLRQQQAQRADWLSKGHGQYRLITQDEFLAECTGSSEWVVVNFCHDEYERCHIMDHHLQIIATNHLECKFLKISAPKAPFFVSKLQIKTLPTLLVFQDGKVVDRLVGFQGLSGDPNKPDDWPTSALQFWLSHLKFGKAAIQYIPPSDELIAEMKRLGLQTSSIYSQNNPYDEDI